MCVMNARRIPECLEAFEGLDTDVCWMTGYTVAELAGGVHADIVASTKYDAYLNVSDDCVVTQGAVDAVVALLADGAPAATGWCRLHTESPFANLCREPLEGNRPTRRAYPFYEAAHVADYPFEVVPTHFMGMSLTGLTRDMWLRFPYGCFTDRRERGYSSDFHLCTRLRDAGVPMVAARSGYVDHVKVRARMGAAPPESHRLLTGEVPRDVRIVAKERV